MHKIVLLFLISLSLLEIQAQENKPSFILEDPLSGTKNYLARDFIKLGKGFSYKPGNSSESFTARLDQCLLFPPTEGTYKTENGIITTDPTLGGLVGSVPGVFGVSPTGAATYSIPIECPVGVNGMQPAVSLVYNSQAGNGIAGWGWKIGGMSMITRVSMNNYNDGMSSTVKWGKDSPLALDGNRLIEVGRYGAADSIEYRTESESFAKVIAVDINNWGPSYFKVYYKDGKIAYYGQNENALFPLKKTRFVSGTFYNNMGWRLTKLTDRDGNFIDYKYEAFSKSNELSEYQYRDQRLSSISYGGNTKVGNTHPITISFLYEDRPDKIDFYINGCNVSQTQRLSSISISVSGTEIRSYGLDYNSTGNYSTLEKVSLDGADGATVNPTVFSRSGNIGNTASINDITTIEEPTDKALMFTVSADYTGDGVADIGQMLAYSDHQDLTKYVLRVYDRYRTNGGAIFTKKRSKDYDMGVTISSSYFGIKEMPGSIGDRLMGDFFNDGTQSILSTKKGIHKTENKPIITFRFTSLKNLEAESTEYKWIYQSSNIKPFLSSGEFDGDMSSDVLVIRDIPQTITGGYKYDATLLFKLGTTVTDFEIKTPSKITEIFVNDFNGDGKDDVFVMMENSNALLSNIFEGGSSYFSSGLIGSTSLIPDLEDGDLFEIGYLNADNLPDFLYRVDRNDWRSAINMGDGNFVCSVQTIIDCDDYRNGDRRGTEKDHDNVFIVDINKDGRNDIVVGDEQLEAEYSWLGYFERYNYKNTIWHTYISTERGYELSSTVTDKQRAEGRFHCFGDFYGKGERSWICHSNVDKYLKVHDTGFLRAHWVDGIKNGFGQTTSIYYGNLSYQEEYYKYNATVSADFRVLRSSSYPVVNSYNDGLNNVFVSYENGIVHTGGRGFLGFLKQTLKNRLTDIEIESSNGFVDEAYARLIPVSVEQRYGSSQPISIQNYSYSFVELDQATKRFFLRKDSESTEDKLTMIKATKAFTEYDKDGNPKKITTSYRGTAITEVQALTYGSYGTWTNCANKVLTLKTTKSRPDDSKDYIFSQSFTYDTKGRLLTHTENLDGNKKLVTTNSDFNDFGLARRIVTSVAADGISQTVTRAFTASGRFLDWEKNDGLEQTTDYEYDEKKGLLLSQTSKVGSTKVGTTSYQYDGFGRLTQTTYPDKVKAVSVVQWAGGSGPTNAAFYVYTQTSGQGPVWKWLDKYGRELRTDGYGLNGMVYVSTEYTPENWLYRVSEPYFDESSKIWGVEYGYDNIGRQEIVTTPMGVTTLSYGGMSIVKASFNGTVETILNNAGELDESIENGKSVKYTYWASGLMKTATPQGASQSVEMHYDIKGNRTSIIDPDAGTITTTYNGFGEILTESRLMHSQDAKELVTTYDYKPNGLLNYVNRNNEITHYKYDSKNRVESVYIENKHSQSFTYDAYDRVIEVAESLQNDKSFTTKTEYDAFGRVVKEVYPTGYYIKNQYDENGYLTGVVDKNGKKVWTAIETNARGQMVRAKHGSREISYSFDKRGLPSTITSAGIVSMTYDFNAQGNLEYRADVLTNQGEEFLYDDQNRLIDWMLYENNDLVKLGNITYDTKHGNVTNKTGVGYTMNYGENNHGPHALTSVSHKPGTFPNAHQTVDYTDFGKVKNITEGNKTLDVTYGIDKQRRKSRFAANGSEMTRYYMPNYEEEVEGSNTRKIHYISGGNGLAAIFVQNGGKDSLYYAYTDYQGSLIAVTDEAGTVKEKMAYDPWGLRRNASDWTQTYAATSKVWGNHYFNRGYTLHEHLDGFALINMNGRVYDPLVARFLSPDPYIQAEGKWLNYNRYGYCFNNPLIYTDPTGEYALIDDLIVMGVGGLINLGVNALQGNVNSWGEAGGYFASGAIAAEVTIYAGPVAGGAVLGVGNDLTTQLAQKSRGEIESVNWSQTTFSGFMGGATAYVGGQISGFATPYVSGLTSNIASPVIQNAVTQGVTNSASGFVLGTGVSLLNGNDLNTALGDGGQGALFGFGMGTISGTVFGFNYARDNNINPWTGKSLGGSTPFTVTPDGVVLPRDAYIPDDLMQNPYGRQGSYGRMVDGKFVETLRIDPATSPGYKGPNQSHFHLDGGKKHIFDINKWPWWNN